jgi:hypothetical protein
VVLVVLVDLAVLVDQTLVEAQVDLEIDLDLKIDLALVVVFQIDFQPPVAVALQVPSVAPVLDLGLVQEVLDLGLEVDLDQLVVVVFHLLVGLVALGPPLALELVLKQSL